MPASTALSAGVQPIPRTARADWTVCLSTIVRAAADFGSMRKSTRLNGMPQKSSFALILRA